MRKFEAWHRKLFVVTAASVIVAPSDKVVTYLYNL